MPWRGSAMAASVAPPDVTMEDPSFDNGQVMVSHPPERWSRTGPPYEFTQDELLEALRAEGSAISESTLRSWAQKGIIPKPIRRLPPGSTDGKSRALYPLASYHVIAWLIDASDHRLSVDELRALSARLFAKVGTPRGYLAPPVREAGAQRPPIPRFPRTSRVLRGAVWAYARRLAELNGGSVREVTLRIRDTSGQDTYVSIDRLRD